MGFVVLNPIYSAARAAVNDLQFRLTCQQRYIFMMVSHNRPFLTFLKVALRVSSMEYFGFPSRWEWRKRQFIFTPFSWTLQEPKMKFCAG